ncbi:hypothetical protein MXB_36, partial [Myxobolus squamalis]
MIVIMKYTWMSRAITVDFELTLMSAVQQEFTDSVIVGCYFHMKHAITKESITVRKLRKLTLEAEEIWRLAADLEFLNPVPITDIDLAILYIRERNPVPADKADVFWTYFARTWINQFPPETWNISEHSESLIVGRTNNALERYNRRIGDAFMNVHPNIASFVTVIRAEFEYYAPRFHIIRSTGEGVKYIET